MCLSIAGWQDRIPISPIIPVSQFMTENESISANELIKLATVVIYARLGPINFRLSRLRNFITLLSEEYEHSFVRELHNLIMDNTYTPWNHKDYSFSNW